LDWKKKSLFLNKNIEQIKRAFKKANRLPFIIGALMGSFVPVAVFFLTQYTMGVSHDIVAGVQEYPWLMGLILGGCVFSAKSVFQWSRAAFAKDTIKAIGFVVILEGCMVLAPIIALKIIAGLFLVLINAFSTGSAVLLEKREIAAMNRKKRKA
jgi:hypothetical protein